MKRRIVLFSLLLVILYPATVWAGWVEQTSGTVQNLNSIFFLTETVGIVAGDNGTILRTTNSGKAWTAKNTGAVNYNDAFLVSAGEGYVLGNSGTILKTEDAGDTFNTLAVPAPVAAANFLKGSFNGNDRVFAAYRGAAADSYLMTSSNGGTTWDTSVLTSLEVRGALLVSGEGGVSIRFVWGKYYKGEDKDQYVILKNGTKVWWSTVKAVKDVFFVNKDTGYAVGEKGLILKTSDGGDSGEWTIQDGGVEKDLNADYFITPSFGWAVGNEGNITFTNDGGTSWVAYTLDNTSIDVRDIFIKLVSAGKLAFVYGYLDTTGGKIFRLSSPTITGVIPNSRPRGWVGTLEVSGTGFIPGARISFPTGGITVVSASVESSSKVYTKIIIPIDATPEAKEMSLTNPDATTTRESNAFTVITGEACIKFSDVWIDGNKYLPPSSETPNIPRITINQQPVISFEVSSAYALTKDTINAVAFTEYSGNYIFSNIPESALTQITAKSMQINYMVPDVLPKGTVVNFTFYVQDSFGNASQECMKVSVAQPADEGTPGWNPPVPAGSKTGQGVLVPDKNTWDPGTDPTLGATLQLLPGTSVQEFQVVVVDFKGTVVYTKKFTYGANNFTAHQVATPNGYVTKINFNFLSNEFAPVLSTGVYLVKIFNLQDNKEIARNYMVLGPKALRPRY